MKSSYILLFLLYPLFSAFASGGNVQYPLRFDRYYSYEEVNEALELLHEKHPSLTTLEKVGLSDEGRAIYALTISNPATGKAEDKPGIYVDGNIHGNEIQAGEVCLYLANYLLTKYESNQQIKQLIDRVSFYILPVVNVDGRWHFFNDANTPSTNRSIRRQQDDDKDGLFDEDAYDDLDGDGNICQMRIKDPDGLYKTSDEDARLLQRIEPGEKGEWTLLGYEGIDNDDDGRYNEDAEGYLDPNRNWPFGWYPDFIQSGAGEYPLSGAGLHAVSNYIEARKNILMVWAFHNSGGMFLRGPSASDLVVPQADIKVYDLLGKNAEKMVPGYKYMPSYELYPTHGDFGEFTYNLMGAYTFVGELFQVESETFNKEGKAETDREKRESERIRFNDYLAHGELYKPWTAYEHPVYGSIEIGGWVKMSSRLPHPYMLPDLVHRNAAAVIYSAMQLPEVEMELIDQQRMSGNIHKIRVRLRNTKGISSMSMHSWQKKLYTPDQLIVEGADVLAGGKIENLYTNQVLYKEYLPHIQFTRIDGFSKVEYEFIVEGKGEINIRFISVKAGSQQLKVNL